MELVQTVFRDGTLTSKCIWQMVIFLPKGGDDYICICLIELGLINFQIRAVFQFHNSLYGIRSGQGTGTAFLEAK